MQTYSQLGQDLSIVNFYNLNNNKREGYFVEIGASDGIDLSNTYLLEKNYGWKGICVEPIPKDYDKLVINRPGSHCVKKAVYSESGLELNFTIASWNLLSGITANVDCHKGSLATGTQITVETESLNDILDRCHAPSFIEYMSLDTEGSEYEILRTINYEKYTFGVIHVEHNYIEPRRTNMKNLLLSKGYLYQRANQFDDEYAHHTLIETN